MNAFDPAEAASAVLDPSIDKERRNLASNFLESWCASPESWPDVVTWLSSPHVSLVSKELCLQLLLKKIRKEIPLHFHLEGILSSIQVELIRLLTSEPTLVSSAGACLAALFIKCQGGIDACLQLCQQINNAKVSLLLVGLIPREMDACRLFTIDQICHQLSPFLQQVFPFFYHSMSLEPLAALKALKNCVVYADLSVSQLSEPVGGVTMLPLLVQLLSVPHVHDEQLIVQACQIIEYSLQCNKNSDEHARKGACTLLYQSIEQQGFLAIPLERSTHQMWDEACLSIAILITTFITEELEDVVTQPAERLLTLLAQILGHSYPKVRMTSLEALLTIQEVPTSERHDHWKKPFYEHVLNIILRTAAYPIDNDDDLEHDPVEFADFRRMVQDVLSSTYFLLRVQMVRRLSQEMLNSHDWTTQEVSLFALNAISRDVSARIQSKGQGSAISSDREETGAILIHLVRTLSSVHPSTVKNPLLLSAVIQFYGAYAESWRISCDYDTILHLMSYLKSAFDCKLPAISTEVGKSIRQILIHSSFVLIANETHLPRLLVRDGGLLCSLVESALLSHNEEALGLVAEGCIRFLTQLKTEPASLGLNAILDTITHQGDDALRLVPLEFSTMSEQHLASVEDIGRCLHALQIIIRFMDSMPGDSDPIIRSKILPFLDRSTRIAQCECALDKVLSVHTQLLRSKPEISMPFFEPTARYVVHIIDKTGRSSALSYLAAAAETYGSSCADFFREILDHVYALLVADIKISSDNTFEFTRSFYDLCQCILLYCPESLLSSSKLSTIIETAVECLDASTGERESIRSTINFISKLFGWKLFHLPNNVLGTFEHAYALIEGQLSVYGQQIIRSCICILVGGSQMLWPVCCDCIYVILIAGSSSLTTKGQSCVIRQWLEASFPENEDPQIYRQVVNLLVEMICDKNANNNKPRTKLLLTDYSKICRGELSADSLRTQFDYPCELK